MFIHVLHQLSNYYVFSLLHYGLELISGCFLRKQLMDVNWSVWTVVITQNLSYWDPKSISVFGVYRLFSKEMYKKFFGTRNNYRNSQVIGLDRYRFRQVSLYMQNQTCNKNCHVNYRII